MRVQLSNINSDVVLIDRSYHDNFLPIAGKNGSIVHELKDAETEYTEWCFDGIHIGYGNRHNISAKEMLYQSTIENIEMHFALGGSSVSHTNSRKKNLVFHFNANQHNILYSKEVDCLYRCKGPDFRFFEVKIKPSVFLKYIAGDERLLSLFQEVIFSGQFSLLQKEHRNITLPMLQIIHEIITCSYKGIFQKMFLEAKVMELLMLQLKQFITIQPEKTSRKNLEQIYAIRDFIANNVSSSYSLIDLAHMVGTNEFALKKGFKEVFGKTVFGYWHDLKMEEAKTLLLDTSLNITEVSDAIGYANARHFSTAFKKKFGVTPSSLKG